MKITAVKPFPVWIGHRNQLIVKVDVAHRGVGTASCGPDVLPQYEIPTGKHTWSYRLSTN